MEVKLREKRASSARERETSFVIEITIKLYNIFLHDTK